MQARPDAHPGAIAIARARALLRLSYFSRTLGQKEMEQRKQLEERAKKLGVSLAVPQADEALPAPAPMPRWMCEAMPEAAAMLGELKAGLDPATWQDLTAQLKAGRGYAVDLSTGVAIGNPPVYVWERARVEDAPGGFKIMRVRRKRVEGPAPPAV